MDYVLSVWANRYDNAVKSAEPYAWDRILKEFHKGIETDDKYSVPLFNLTRFVAKGNTPDFIVEDKALGGVKPRRVQANVIAVDALIIDYDNDSRLQHLWTMDEVAEKFKDYAFLMYSSHSYWKNHPEVEKFRLILPFSQSMPISAYQDDWIPYVASMKRFIGYAEPEVLPEEFQSPDEDTGKVATWDKPSIDKASFNPVQGYFLPSCPVGKEVVYRVNNTEKFLDPFVFEKAEIKKPEMTPLIIPPTATRGGTGKVIRETFDVFQWVKDNGLYMRPLGGGKHQIVCPWLREHTGADKSGTVLLPPLSGSLPNIHCRHNHNVSTWKLIKEQGDEAIRSYCMTRSDDDFSDELAAVLKRHRNRKEDEVLDEKERKRIQVEDLFPGITTEPVQPYTRAKREELIRKKCLNYIPRKDENITLLYAFEGFGKSYYATLLVKEKKRKVLFASISNEQAAEQADSFRSHGLRVQFIPGREHLLRKNHKVEVQHQEGSTPWDTERVAETSTKKWMKDNQKLSDEQIDQIWTETEAPEPNFSEYDIVCTTIARVMSYGRIQRNRLVSGFGFVVKRTNDAEGLGIRDDDRIVPANVVVFFDDPDREFFTWNRAYDPKYWERIKEGRKQRLADQGLTEDDLAEIPEEIRIDHERIEVEKINGRDYFVRPDGLVLGYGLIGNQLVFTTTEELTRRLILRMYDNVYEPTLMPESKMKAGDITMVKTNIVASKRDGFLPPMMNRLQKEGYEFNYIADGQGSMVNLVNNKGQNIFADKDNVIEISEPHNDVVTRFIDELHDDGWTESDRNAMKVILAMDAVQQAIGRNSGYRWSDKPNHEKRECVVLCEPKLHAALIKYMRYHVGTAIDDVKKQGTAKRDYGTLVGGLCWYIRNLDSYLRNGIDTRGQAFMDDVKEVRGGLPNGQRRTFTKRLVAALKEKIRTCQDTAMTQKLEKYALDLGD
jgi:hypothetical protein